MEIEDGGMGKVKIAYGGWDSQVDQLDGATLEDGEMLMVEFPDTTVEYMRVVVKSFEWGIMRRSQAFISLPYKGLRTEVRLMYNGLRAERA